MILNEKTFKELRKNLNIHSLERIDIIGIRGAKTNIYNEFKSELEIESQTANYKTMKCLFLIHKDNSFIAFHGSTVPNLRYVKESLASNIKTNQLSFGVFRAYNLGKHSIGKPSEHEALRQTRNQPIIRTYDDLDFDEKDSFEVSNPYDNIHASWCKLDSEYFESMGCQVIQGYPKCQKRKTNSGDWKVFIETIKSMNYKMFTYLLIPFKWLNLKSEICMFGSHSDKVKELQQKLKIEVDGFFGKETFLKVIEFQKKNNLKVDGIVGQQTFSKL